MIIGKIHPGSGLGDQLFSYIATRVRAADLSVDFGFVGKEFFKGSSFMNLDWGMGTDIKYHVEEPRGKLVIDNWQPEPRYHLSVVEINKPYYDPEFNFIPDGSVIDGYGAQDIRYFEHRLAEVREWLKVDGFEQGEEIGTINFRGGEYTMVPELYLPSNYWQEAIKLLDNKYPGIRYEVHTDDVFNAELMIGSSFPKFSYISNIKYNWKAIRYAKHLIISNSAFAILPALLNENVKEVIAPKYWAGRNVGEWRRPNNYYKKFTYL